MGYVERPLAAGHDTNQEAQYRYLEWTFNTKFGGALNPTTRSAGWDEDTLLRAIFGEPVDGVYGKDRHGDA